MSKLFSEFEVATEKDWLSKIEKDLKGKPLNSLDWQLNEQITIAPFAHAEGMGGSYAPMGNNQASNQWELSVKIAVAQMKSANKEALLALENGATAICFELEKNPTEEELKTLFKDIQLEWISTHFIFRQKGGKRFIEYFIQYLNSQNIDSKKINCSFSVKENMFSAGKDAPKWSLLVEKLPKAQFLTINARPFYKGKEKVVEELAQCITAGNNQLVALNEYGLELEKYQHTIQFSISLSDSYFLNIAKIRALKLLWQQILAAWEVPLTSFPIIEVHLGKESQVADENYNKIKATAQAMSAIVSGVKRLYIAPSDSFKKGKDATPFAQRIALNIQHLMQLESYMDRVIDPAAGSYYIEQMTDKLAEAAWQQFQE